ncbi:MAG: ABC transporter ATP-binding protein, partial [Desulfobacula sp.]|nr:ABC transporter ATP-binding protein [Desulfobacula sp.]
MNADNILLSVNNVVKHFDISGGFLDQITFRNGRVSLEKISVKAVNDVSFFVKKGEVLGVVGESGCGKSTVARTIMGLYPPNSGEIYYDGK